MTVYRDVPTDPHKSGAPAELICTAAAASGRGRSGLALLLGLTLPLTASAFLVPFVGVFALVLGMATSATVAVTTLRRSRRINRCVLRIDGETVSIRATTGTTRMRLDCLADVVLDTRTVRGLQDGGSMIPAMRIIDSRVAPEVDIARVVLVEDDGTTTAMSEERLAHMDAIEWLGKVRLFLRKHGWVPEDEREGDAIPAE